MPLRIELKPNERLIIGPCAIRNGPRRTSFIVETDHKVLRESEIVRESEADTPAKQICVALQRAYVLDDPFDAETHFMALASAVMEAAPSARPYIAAIYERIAAGDRYRALKAARDLVAFEARLLDGAEPAAIAPAA
ncbi:flagellar biosynthesis repressor FlbT [Methylobacterium trifolii]|uniref:Flagellum biosynthesis repressor protein FlbT n=1 Tax=Methylobacterium trifolii TaxID=1003092 RepID=A0ABQ4TY15_9HYPH|nr:flagellar biosynthesis repressor FlbT [Methylobacterium trifolii]GJE59951.1 flagellum biosynthesis repressor protein FlbT [Methylobacterium trifolii]